MTTAQAEPKPSTQPAAVRYWHSHDPETIRACWSAAVAIGQVRQHWLVSMPLEPPQAVTMCKVVGHWNGSAYGYAFCSTHDQFSRRLGRRIAEGRARKALRGREERGR